MLACDISVLTIRIVHFGEIADVFEVHLPESISFQSHLLYRNIGFHWGTFLRSRF